MTGSDPAPRHPPADPEGDRKRIDDIDAELKKLRGTVDKARPSDGAAANGVSHRQTGVAYRVLVDMIAGLLVGGFLGYWLDRLAGWAPWSLLGGLILGFAAGVNNAWRAIRVYSDDVAKGEGRRLP